MIAHGGGLQISAKFLLHQFAERSSVHPFAREFRLRRLHHRAHLLLRCRTGFGEGGGYGCFKYLLPQSRQLQQQPDEIPGEEQDEEQ